MVVSAGDDQRPDRGLGVVQEMVRELIAGSSAPSPACANSCRERPRPILSSSNKAAIEPAWRRVGHVEARLDRHVCRVFRHACGGGVAIPNLLGTWKGESESIVMGPGNAHHSAAPAAGPRLNSIPFTMTIDKQDGRRFSGAFTSARGNDTIIAVISRNGSIYMVDDDGYTIGTILAPNRMELATCGSRRKRALRPARR